MIAIGWRIAGMGGGSCRRNEQRSRPGRGLRLPDKGRRGEGDELKDERGEGHFIVREKSVTENIYIKLNKYVLGSNDFHALASTGYV